MKFERLIDLYEYMHDNKSDLIASKKSNIKHTDSIKSININNFDKHLSSTKALVTNYNEDPNTGIIKRSVIGNTYNWLDSHGDVHIGNTFKKSIGETKKIFHYHDHVNQLDAQIGKFNKVFEKQVSWYDLGVNKEGDTTILVGESDIIKEYNPSIFKQYLDGDIDQHSVGMYYVKIDLALNSDSSEHKEEFETYNKYLDQIGNVEKVNEEGYFWAVSEAKLSEISAVTKGSNIVTPTIQNEPSTKDTQQEPFKDTQKIDWNYIVNNVKF